MIIPATFAASYDRELATVQAVRELAAARMRVACANHQWLFEDRIKSQESALAKAETGLVSGLADMVDLYAATVIVPVRSEVDRAVEALCEIFDATPGDRRRDVFAFPYDDVHLTAVLGAKKTPPVRPQAVIERRFEIQVRTGTMWSWWRATHDTIYKGGHRDWRTQRVAAQARAGLELTDALLNDLPAAAQLQMARPDPGDHRLDQAARIADHWNATRRPGDIVRFSETVLAYADAVGLQLDDLSSAVTEGANPLTVEPGITPTEATMIATARLSSMAHVEALSETGRRLFITAEMETVESKLSTVASGQRVRL